MTSDRRSGIGRELCTPPDAHKDNNVSHGLVFVGLCIVALLVLYALGQYIDMHAEATARQLQQTQDAQMAEQILAGAKTAQVREAYQQGLNDALFAVRNQPEGIALLQACIALQSHKQSPEAQAKARPNNLKPGA